MSSPKILVADDSVTIQKVIRLALSHEGYEIRSVSHESELLEQMALFQPDIIIMDSSLSGASAFDIKEKINENTDYQKIKFILMSNTFEIIDDSKLEEAQFHARLTKPFDPGQLRETIESLFNKEQDVSMNNDDIKPFHESTEDEDNSWSINESAKKGLLNNIHDHEEELQFEVDHFKDLSEQTQKPSDEQEIEFDLDLNIDKSNDHFFQTPNVKNEASFSEKDIKSHLEIELRKLTQKLLPEIAEKILKEEINRLLEKPPSR